MPAIEQKSNSADSGGRDCGGAALLYIFDCKKRVPGRRQYQDVPRVATFKLPELADKAQYDNIYSISDNLSAQYSSGIGRPFVLDPSFSLIAMQLQVGATRKAGLGIDGGPYSQFDVRLLLFVHANTLERRCQGNVRNLSVEWEDWAQHARLFRNPGYPTDWFGGPVSYTRSIVPERTRGNNNGVVDFALPDLHEEFGGELTCWLYDFAPPEALRAAEAAAGGKGPWTYIMEPDSLPRLPIFRTPTTATSGLPYRKLNTGCRLKWLSVPQLNGDWIIRHTEKQKFVPCSMSFSVRLSDRHECDVCNSCGFVIDEYC